MFRRRHSSVVILPTEYQRADLSFWRVWIIGKYLLKSELILGRGRESRDAMWGIEKMDVYRMLVVHYLFQSLVHFLRHFLFLLYC